MSNDACKQNYHWKIDIRLVKKLAGESNRVLDCCSPPRKTHFTEEGGKAENLGLSSLKSIH